MNKTLQARFKELETRARKYREVTRQFTHVSGLIESCAHDLDKTLDETNAVTDYTHHSLDDGL